MGGKNGTIHKNWLNNTLIQEEKVTRLNRQLLKFTDNCKSLLTAFIDT